MRKRTSDAMTLPTEVSFREPQREPGPGQEPPLATGGLLACRSNRRPITRTRPRRGRHPQAGGTLSNGGAARGLRPYGRTTSGAHRASHRLGAAAGARWHPGIGRGMIDMSAVNAVHAHMTQQMQVNGV